MEINNLITFVIGTRPEAIKLAPLIKIFKESKKLKVRVLLSGQHSLMVKQVMDLFNLTHDKNLNLMKNNQSINYITQEVLSGMRSELIENRPQLVFVQGDTTTAFAASLAAFYEKIPIAHVEAGLRTGKLLDPYPEEANRRLISQISTLHFAPTEMARNNLFSSGIKENVYVTGNTIIDALQMISKISKPFLIDGVNLKNKNLILATVHRRENWGENLKNIAYGLRNIIENDNSAILIIPLHKNPKVREPLKNILKGNKRIILTEPLDYDELISILKVCKFVITDSGGLQEESPTFGKPVLVIRKSTERLEAVEAGCAKLIGIDKNNIIKESMVLLNNPEKYLEMSKVKNPFGKGDSSRKIFEHTLKFFES
tara:strand:- start:2419 stop:3531 length:1113 start_codon:yes stop_codon:yes gene_type:complete